MRKLFIVSAAYVAQNGLTGVGSINFCLVGTRLFVSKEDEKKIENALEKLTEQNATVHHLSSITASENSAIKAITQDYNEHSGGMLVIINDALIQPVSKALKAEFSKVTVLQITGEKTDTVGTSEAQKKEPVPTENRLIRTVPDGRGTMEAWTS